MDDNDNFAAHIKRYSYSRSRFVQRHRVRKVVEQAPKAINGIDKGLSLL